MLSFVAVFINRTEFENCAKFVLNQFDKQWVGDFVNPMTQIFMMVLTEKFLVLEPRDWRGEGKSWSVDIFKEEPLFAELWQYWDTEDMELIESLLIQLANRHTFQASRNNKDGGRDFEGHAEQYPIDLHFIMRLREWRGLSNPEIKHRLTESPFDKLPEPVEKIQFPEELRQVVKKMREFMPDFDAVINSGKNATGKCCCESLVILKITFLLALFSPAPQPNAPSKIAKVTWWFPQAKTTTASSITSSTPNSPKPTGIPPLGNYAPGDQVSRLLDPKVIK